MAIAVELVFTPQDMKQDIVLVMELCEYNLDFLVKQSPLTEDDITLLLYQLGGFMVSPSVSLQLSSLSLPFSLSLPLFLFLSPSPSLLPSLSLSFPLSLFLPLNLSLLASLSLTLSVSQTSYVHCIVLIMQGRIPHTLCCAYIPTLYVIFHTKRWYKSAKIFFEITPDFAFIDLCASSLRFWSS